METTKSLSKSLFHGCTELYMYFYICNIILNLIHKYSVLYGAVNEEK